MARVTGCMIPGRPTTTSRGAAVCLATQGPSYSNRAMSRNAAISAASAPSNPHAARYPPARSSAHSAPTPAIAPPAPAPAPPPRTPGRQRPQIRIDRVIPPPSPVAPPAPDPPCAQTPRSCRHSGTPAPCPSPKHCRSAASARQYCRTPPAHAPRRKLSAAPHTGCALQPGQWQAGPDWSCPGLQQPLHRRRRGRERIGIPPAPHRCRNPRHFDVVLRRNRHAPQGPPSRSLRLQRRRPGGFAEGGVSSARPSKLHASAGRLGSAQTRQRCSDRRHRRRTFGDIPDGSRRSPAFKG